jgi:serine/threonine-protein kinase
MNPDDGGYGYDDRPDRRRQQQKKKSNTSTILLVVAGLLVLVGAILIGRYIFAGDGVSNNKVAVPNFVGQSQDAASKSAVNSDLKPKFTEKACEDQAKGNICDQNPARGTQVDKNTTVTLVVSTGAPKVAVPDVTGLTYDKAKSELEDKGFVVDQKTEESDRTPGVVIGQDPNGDTDQEKGSTITLTVAKEIAKSTVPDVGGMTCDEAKARMTENNLTGNCLVDTETEDANLVNKVVSTDPQSGTSVVKNSTVAIHIGKAAEKQQVQVPTVTQMTVKDAKKTLEDNGLAVGQIGGSSDDNALVLTQDPQPGTSVDEGTPVNLVAVAQNNNGNNNGGGIFGGGTGTAARTETRPPTLGCRVSVIPAQTLKR